MRGFTSKCTSFGPEWFGDVLDLGIGHVEPALNEPQVDLAFAHRFEERKGPHDGLDDQRQTALFAFVLQHAGNAMMVIDDVAAADGGRVNARAQVIGRFGGIPQKRDDNEHAEADANPAIALQEAEEFLHYRRRLVLGHGGWPR